MDARLTTAVPSDLATACVAYGKAVDQARRLDAGGAAHDTRDDAIDAAVLAETAMVERFRHHGVGAAVVDGRLYVDAACGGPTIPGVGTAAGGAVIELAGTRGL